MNKTAIFLTVGSMVLVNFCALFLAMPQKAAADYCVSHTSTQCISNISYWYNSCGVLEDINQNCNTTNQICQNGQCVNKAPTPTATPNPTPAPTSNTSHYVKSCYNGNMYWYSQQGTLGDLAQSCADTNSCTIDDCLENACTHQLKCDGSTCATSSQDYAKYCSSGTSGTQNPGQTQTTGNQNNQNQGQIQNGGLAISLFEATGSNLSLWQKNISAKPNDNVTFLIVVKNNSQGPIDNVFVRTDLTSNISYTGNLKVDNVAAAGNIASGVNLGAINQGLSRIVFFTGTVTSTTIGTNQGALQIIASVGSGQTTYDSDYTTINMGAQSSQTTTSSNSLLDNLKKNWLIWIIIIVVLVVVFIIIFRRLSSNV